MKVNETRDRLLNTVANTIQKYEFPILIIIGAALLMNRLDAKWVNMLITLVLCVTAFLYVLSAFDNRDPEGYTQMDGFFRKIGGFSSAFVLVGILYTLKGFPGSKQILVAGAPSLFFAVGYILVKGRVEKFGKATVIRMAVLALLAIAAFLSKSPGEI
ncbi:MAG: hypothetical protein R3277_11475 [Brumimicrobium sp.]|nr:hypothetical protein [Brumimicrobium sp.]